MNSITCKNCNHYFSGKFCPNCGQPAKTNTITWQYILHDIPHSVFHIDKGFFYTFIQLAINPGLAIKEYVAGKRVQHFKPFAYVIIMSTICTILIPLLEKLMQYIYTIQNTGYKLEVRTLFWEKYISLFIFLMIPLLSGVTYLSFRNKRYNFWEHFTGNTYLAAQLNIFLICIKLFALSKMLFGYLPDVNFTVFMFLFMFYYSYTFKIWMSPHKSFLHLFIKLIIMNFFIASIYMTGLSLTGIMTPWWDFK